MLIWPDEFCAALADCGFQLARFDNRDTGLSTHLAAQSAPGWLKVLLHPASAPYRLDDMAGDAVAVLDALGWPSAPGAKLASYPGMGHDLSRELWPTIVAEISALAGQPAPAGARAGGNGGAVPSGGGAGPSRVPPA